MMDINGMKDNVDPKNLENFGMVSSDSTVVPYSSEPGTSNAKFKSIGTKRKNEDKMYELLIDIRHLKQRRRDGPGTGFLIPSYFSRPQFPVADLVVKQMHS